MLAAAEGRTVPGPSSGQAASRTSDCTHQKPSRGGEGEPSPGCRTTSAATPAQQRTPHGDPSLLGATGAASPQSGPKLPRTAALADSCLSPPPVTSPPLPETETTTIRSASRGSPRKNNPGLRAVDQVGVSLQPGQLSLHPGKPHRPRGHPPQRPRLSPDPAFAPTTGTRSPPPRSAGESRPHRPGRARA